MIIATEFSLLNLFFRWSVAPCLISWYSGNCRMTLVSQLKWWAFLIFVQLLMHDTTFIFCHSSNGLQVNSHTRDTNHDEKSLLLLSVSKSSIKKNRSNFYSDSKTSPLVYVDAEKYNDWVRALLEAHVKALYTWSGIRNKTPISSGITMRLQNKLE